MSKGCPVKIIQVPSLPDSVINSFQIEGDNLIIQTTDGNSYSVSLEEIVQNLNFTQITQSQKDDLILIEDGFNNDLGYAFPL